LGVRDKVETTWGVCRGPDERGGQGGGGGLDGGQDGFVSGS